MTTTFQMAFIYGRPYYQKFEEKYIMKWNLYASNMEDEKPSLINKEEQRNFCTPLPSLAIKDEKQKHIHTWFEFSSRPLYTLPNPPSPSTQSPRKFLVAAANSRKAKVFAAI